MKRITWKNYEAFLTAFSDVMGDVKAEALVPAKVIAYSIRPGWGQAHRYNLLGSIKSAFKWADETGMIARNPLRGLKRPSMPSRGSKALIDPIDREKLFQAAPPAFRLFLTLLHGTGARPSELARLTAADVDFAAGVATLVEHKTAHKTGLPRLIVLTPAAVDILREQVAIHPDGPLLRNDQGREWTHDRLQNVMKRTNAKAGTRVILYAFRHTYATDALASGVPDATVAALLGQTGTTMLHRHYSHLLSRVNVLREAAAKVR